MKHNYIFKAGILIALFVFLAGTPNKVYADVQENIVTTEDGYTDKQGDNVSGETDTDEIENLEKTEKINDEESIVDEKKSENKEKIENSEKTENEETNATQNGRNFDWPVAVIAVLLTALCVMGFMRARKDRKNLQHFRELLEDFDREYDKYKRNYAYCVEEILKKENDDLEKGNVWKNVMRKDIAEVYIKMSEIKKQRDCFSVKNMRTGGKSIKSDMKSMKELYKSVQQYGNRLERYLFKMREKD